MFFFLGISYFCINSKKEDDLTSASYLHAGHLLSQAKWSQPFWLTNFNRGRKLLSQETQFICLFQNCVGPKLSSTLFPLEVAWTLGCTNKTKKGKSYEKKQFWTKISHYGCSTIPLLPLLLIKKDSIHIAGQYFKIFVNINNILISKYCPTPDIDDISALIYYKIDRNRPGIALKLPLKLPKIA